LSDVHANIISEYQRYRSRLLFLTPCLSNDGYQARYEIDLLFESKEIHQPKFTPAS